MLVTEHLKRPTRIRCGRHHRIPIWPCSGWGLPSRTVLPRCAVRSYRTFSPLPPINLSRWGRRFAFCCTFRGFAPPRRYLAPCPTEPGLSSTCISARSDRLADSRRQHNSASIAALVFHRVVVQLVARAMRDSSANTRGLRRWQFLAQNLHQRRNLCCTR